MTPGGSGTRVARCWRIDSRRFAVEPTVRARDPRTIMPPALIEYFAWGLLLTVVITSVAIVHRELRGVLREKNGHDNGTRRQPR